ncbi:MAG TPA: hypothetical protein VF338_09375 [Leptolinea sp.]
MSKHKEKQKLTGPWRNIHGAVWLIGLAIIAWQGWWWPGILILVAISMILEAVIMKIAPDAVVTVTKGDDESSSFQNSPSIPPQPISPPVHRADLLPANCPKCGGPTRGHEVHWTGDQSADCPYCGANLPMKSS